MMNNKIPRRQIVLLGVGHTNAHIVKMWRMNAYKDTALVCVSNFPIATYSGMLPGVLSGQYETPEMEIDLFKLTQACGARLIVDQVCDVDVKKQQLVFDQRPPLHFDALSIGIGSLPSFSGVSVSEDANLVKIKPMQTFLDRLESALAQHQHKSGPFRIVIVGGGVGGVEVSLCLGHRLNRSGIEFELSVVHTDHTVGSGLLPSTRRRIQDLYRSRGVVEFPESHVVAIKKNEIVLRTGSSIDCDLVIWATDATAPALLKKIDLAKDGKGFVLTESTLQSISNPNIFAVGDSGTIKNDPTPKAGVYAVRQGPVLWKNLRNLLEAKPLQRYAPQRGFLKLLNTGDGRAIAEYKYFSVVSKLGWFWKNWIDKRFMLKFQDLPLSMSTMHDDQSEQPKMRCVGCGGKLGANILSEVLHSLVIKSHPGVLAGLDQADDAALLKTGPQTLVTTDFFATPLDDPWLMGRVAVLNSISDCYAMGAAPTTALANVQVPFGTPRRQKEVLIEVMKGAVDELDRAGAALVGGHSIEGPRLLIGFTVLATPQNKTLKKSGLQHGDDLILTKPLGTGALLAAHMQAKCSAGSMTEMIDSMMLSNSVGLKLVENEAVHALTDVTGFGLAGHLSEMLAQSKCSAKLYLDHLPLLSGFAACINQGIESTMAAENRSIESQMGLKSANSNESNYAALFDPQTSGGLLFGCAPDQTAQILQTLAEFGFDNACKIGRATSGDGPLITFA